VNTGQTVPAQFDLFFIPPDLVTLTVNKTGGNPDGTVTSDPPGISCAPGCDNAQASFQRGTVVTLTAVPDEDSSFDQWQSGPCAGGQGAQCTFTMDQDQTATADFDNDDD
jgi:hypothetical protein